MTTLTRLAALERRAIAIEARLTALEQAGPNPTTDTTALLQRLDAVERQLDPVTGSVLRDTEA